MARGVFDIFQTDSGYTAVDNPVRRQILEALEQGDKELPELVEITGKSKPTLSATHMKDLLGRGLVAEAPHPTDGRRKVFRIIAKRIGASDVPVPQLQRAVESYVAVAPLQGRVPLLDVLEIITSVPDDAKPTTLMAQGERLGWSLAAGLRVPDVASIWMRLVRWFEEQGVARATRMDVDAAEVELVVDTRLTGRREHIAAALAGVVSGVVLGLELLPDIDVQWRVDGDRLVLFQA